MFSLIFIDCQKSAPENSDLSAQDVANIHLFLKSYDKNAISSDWTSDVLFYAEDAIRFTPSGNPIKGKKAIQSDLKTVEFVSSYTHKILDFGC